MSRHSFSAVYGRSNQEDWFTRAVHNHVGGFKPKQTTCPACSPSRYADMSAKHKKPGKRAAS